MLNWYLTLEGETQGLVEGSVTQAGREGTMEVYGWEHEIVAPRDLASGLPTGKRQHKPFTVCKPMDQATPLLFAILTQNENITTWKIDGYRPERTGHEKNFYTIELVNASICGIRYEGPNNRHEKNMRITELEYVSFCYQKIITTFNDPTKTAEDDWESPQAS